jgi:hypothetical protein
MRSLRGTMHGGVSVFPVDISTAWSFPSTPKRRPKVRRLVARPVSPPAR